MVSLGCKMSMSTSLRDEARLLGKVLAMNPSTLASDLLSLLSADPFRQARGLRNPVDVRVLRQRAGLSSAPDSVWEQALIESGLTFSLVFPGMLYRTNEAGNVEFVDADAAARDIAARYA